MKIAILDGGGEPNNRFDSYVDDLVDRLQTGGHEVEHCRLSQLKLHLCTGCWSCWVKTPGRCALKDDGPRVLESYLSADLVLFASPLSLGFVSGVMKKAIDKLIPLFMPQIILYHGECVHAPRYESHPALGCLLHRGEYDEEDVGITREYLRRYAFHFQTDLALDATTDTPIEEVCHAVDRL